MVKEQIIQEIEQRSGFLFPDFQQRMNSEAYDALMVMKDIRAKYTRWITDDLLITEFGIKKGAVGRSVAMRAGDIKWMNNGIIKMPWR